MREIRYGWYHNGIPIEPLPMTEREICDKWILGEMTVTQLASANAVGRKIIYDILKDNGAWKRSERTVSVFDIPRNIPILEMNCEESKIIKEILSTSSYLEPELQMILEGEIDAEYNRFSEVY